MADFRYLGEDEERRRIGFGGAEFTIGPDGSFGPGAAPAPGGIPPNIGDIPVGALGAQPALDPGVVPGLAPGGPGTQRPLPVDAIPPGLLAGPNPLGEQPPLGDEADPLQSLPSDDLTALEEERLQSVGADALAALEAGVQPPEDLPPYRSAEDAMRADRTAIESRKEATAGAAANRAEEFAEIGAVLDATAGVFGDLGDATKQLWADAGNKLDEDKAVVKDLTDQLVASKVERKSLLHGSTAQKIAQGLFLALGAIGGAITAKQQGGKMQNLALNYVMQQIETDVQDQRAAIEKLGGTIKMKEGQLRHFYDLFKDKEGAMAATAAVEVKKQQIRLEAIAKKHEGTRQGEMAQEAIAILEQERVKLELKVGEAQKRGAIDTYKAQTQRLLGLKRIAKTKGSGSGSGTGKETKKGLGASNWEGGTEVDWASRLGVDLTKTLGLSKMKLLVPLSWDDNKYVIAVSTEAQKELSNYHVSAKGIARKAGQLRAMIRKHGNEISSGRYSSDVAAVMETLIADLVTEMKNSKGLGALDEGSIQLAKKYFGNPTVIKLNAQSVAAKLEEVMKQTRKGWGDRVQVLAQAGNYKGYFPKVHVKYEDIPDIGETRLESRDKATIGATGAIRAEGVKEFAQKSGAGPTEKGANVGEAIIRATSTLAEIDDAIATLEAREKVETDDGLGGAKYEIGLALTRLRAEKKEREKIAAAKEEAAGEKRGKAAATRRQHAAPPSRVPR